MVDILSLRYVNNYYYLLLNFNYESKNGEENEIIRQKIKS